MTMKLRILLLPLLLAFCPARAGDLAALLPEDTTLAVVGPDVGKLSKLDGHPIAKALATPELKKLFAPFLEQYATDRERNDRIMKEETGMNLDEVNALLKGPFAYGYRVDFPGLIAAAEKRKPDGEMPSPFQFMETSVAMTFDGSEELAGKIAKGQGRVMSLAMTEAGKAAGAKSARFPEDFDASTEEYHGATLHLWKLRRGEKSLIEAVGWVLLDKAFVVGLSEQALRGSVDRAKNGARSLADSASYRSTVAQAKNSDLAAYLDMKGIVAQLMKMAEQRAKPGLVPVDPVKAMEAIGIRNFEALYGAFTFSETAAEGEVGVTFDQKPLLLDLVALDGPGTAPDFIPADADSGSYGTFHFSRLMPAVEKMVAAAAPVFVDIFTAQIDMLKKTSGVDLQKDLFGNMGPNSWSASAPNAGSPAGKKSGDEDEPEPEESQVFGIQLKDRKAFELALDSLINVAAPGKALFEESEYQGFTIKRMKGASSPVAFLTTDEWLIIATGPQDLCERILSRMKSGATDGLFSQPHVREAVAGLPEGGHGTGYMDLNVLFNQLLPLLSGLEEVPGIEKFMDLDELPEKVNIPLDLASRQFMDAHSLSGRIRIGEKAK